LYGKAGYSRYGTLIQVLDRSLVLVDGSSFLFRAYFALPELTNSKHHPTGAMHGVVSMLTRLRNDFKTDFFGVIFDPRGPTLRNEWYPEYKANRPSMPKNLEVQIAPLHEMIKALGFPLLQIEGIEADDVIGTLASRAEKAGTRVLISTGDKDFAQLVSPNVSLINTEGSIVDEDAVLAKFGVMPERIVDYLTLVGDTVDNIPGVPKVGPKTAVKWLNQYGSLDGVVEHAGEIKGKVGESLRATLEKIPLSRRLVTIVKDIEVGITVDDLVTSQGNQERLAELYQEYELNSWLRRLRKDSDLNVASDEKNSSVHETILEEKQFNSWLEQLRSAEVFAFDTETTSLDYMSARLVGLSFACKPGQAAYVPLNHDYAGVPEQLDMMKVLGELKPLLENEDKKKIGHNLKYDRNVLLNYGIELRGIAYDTMLESYILNSTASRHDLDSVALKYIDHRTIHYEEVAGKGTKQISFDQVEIEQAAPYAAEDADVCLRLHGQIMPLLRDEKKPYMVFNDIEMPLVPVIADMERRGVLIDTKMLLDQSAELGERLQELESAAHTAAGEVFNIASPKQIQHILFDNLDLPVLSKTPKGQPSTAESVLQELSRDHPVPKLILEHRTLSKLKSTYTDKLPQQVNRDTGRVHTSYHQAVTATGRLSSADPNLQNIPVRTVEGRRIRQAFIAPPTRCLLAADYSQIELRIMAHLSGDENLCEAFAREIDVHQATAAEVFGLTPGEVPAEKRRAAKAINFGLIYGMSAFGLARQLGIDRGAAQQYIDLYFERYPSVKTYMEETKESARKRGYVETVFGRRLHLPDIEARNVQRRQYAERTAINAPMQGTAADIIKRAMLAVDEWFKTESVSADLIMQVHDELVIEVLEDEAEHIGPEIARLMSEAAELTVPLVVEVGRGANWDEAH